MMTLPPSIKVYVATQPVDMRKNHHGLSAIVEAVLQQNIFSGHLFVFFGSRKDRIKILYWDRNGYALWYKRLSEGRYVLPRVSGKVFTMNAQELSLLLEGIDLTSRTRLHAV